MSVVLQGEVNRDLADLNSRLQRHVVMVSGPTAAKSLYDMVDLREAQLAYPDKLQKRKVTSEHIDRALEQVEVRWSVCKEKLRLCCMWDKFAICRGNKRFAYGKITKQTINT